MIRLGVLEGTEKFYRNHKENFLVVIPTLCEAFRALIGKGLNSGLRLLWGSGLIYGFFWYSPPSCLNYPHKGKGVPNPFPKSPHPIA